MVRFSVRSDCYTPECEIAMMADDEFTASLRSSQYPKGMTKGEKANFRRICKNNFRFETGILYYKNNGIDEASQWKIDLRAIRQ